MLRSTSIPFLVVASMLCLVGCDLLKPKVSQVKLEEAMSSWLKEHDIQASEIHCPGDQPLEKGHTFECTCEVHSKEIPVSVEVTDPESGTVEWEPKYLTLPKAAVETEILAKPQFMQHDLTIDCHDAVWVSIPDSEWSCEITDKADNKKYVAKVVFSDGEGAHKMMIEDA